MYNAPRLKGINVSESKSNPGLSIFCGSLVSVAYNVEKNRYNSLLWYRIGTNEGGVKGVND